MELRFYGLFFRVFGVFVVLFHVACNLTLNFKTIAFNNSNNCHAIPKEKAHMHTKQQQIN